MASAPTGQAREPGADPDVAVAELQRADAELLRKLEERDAALAQHSSEYGERVAYQAATIDVLKAMSVRPAIRPR